MTTDRVKVLLVEVNQSEYLVTRDLLSRIEDVAFHLEWASSYGAAMAAMANEGHDVYLIAYRLGDLNGLDLLREARRSGRRTPAILLIEEEDRTVDFDAMNSGAADCLVKHQLSANLVERSIRYEIGRAHV